MKKLTVAITGGIGSGKTTVGKLFEQAGYPLIIADELAKEILIEDQLVRRQVVEFFGEEAYSGGQLNKKFLADKVFQDKDNVSKINSIVHPKVISKITEMSNECFKKVNIVFVEAALIYEANMENMFDFIVLVASNDNNKIDRVVERDNAALIDIKKRIANQIPDSKKRIFADFIIENNSTLDDLFSNSKFILSLLERMISA